MSFIKEFLPEKKLRAKPRPTALEFSNPLLFSKFPLSSHLSSTRHMATLFFFFFFLEASHRRLCVFFFFDFTKETVGLIAFTADYTVHIKMDLK
jgi:hypothetical protein